MAERSTRTPPTSPTSTTPASTSQISQPTWRSSPPTPPAAGRPQRRTGRREHRGDHRRLTPVPADRRQGARAAQEARLLRAQRPPDALPALPLPPGRQRSKVWAPGTRLAATGGLGAAGARVAGRIRDEDIALVREQSPIAEVIGEYLQLRNAGGGSLKGLCPFHDEKTPSVQRDPGPRPVVLLLLRGRRGRHQVRGEDRQPLLPRGGRAPRRPGRHRAPLRAGRPRARPGAEPAAPAAGRAPGGGRFLRRTAAARRRPPRRASSCTERGFELADAERFGCRLRAARMGGAHPPPARAAGSPTPS